MAYLNTIPTATSTLSASQPQLLENFSQLQIQWSKDHDSLLAGAATGKHLKVSMPRSAADPALISATDLTLYAKLSGASTELFMRNSLGIKQISSGGVITGYIKAMGSVSVAGAISNSVGVTPIAGRPPGLTGRYEIIFTAGLMPDANYIVILTPVNVTNMTAHTMPGTKTQLQFTVGTSYGGWIDSAFDFIVLHL